MCLALAFDIMNAEWLQGKLYGCNRAPCLPFSLPLLLALLIVKCALQYYILLRAAAKLQWSRMELCSSLPAF